MSESAAVQPTANYRGLARPTSTGGALMQNGETSQDCPTSWPVVDAARRAWELHDTRCHFVSDEPKVDGILGAINLPERNHIEVFIEEASDRVWRALGEWPRNENWLIRVVVPLPALGSAHEALRDHGCEVQGYWMSDDGAVVFGSVEIA